MASAGAVFFGSLFVVGAPVAFWWIESGEVANAFTYGGRDSTSYPVPMYGEWFRKLIAFGLGFAFVAYLPRWPCSAGRIRSARPAGCTGARRWSRCWPPG